MSQSLVDSLIFKATKSYNNKNYSDAEQLYNEVLKIDPKHINCLNYLATLFAQTNRNI